MNSSDVPQTPAGHLSRNHVGRRAVLAGASAGLFTGLLGVGPGQATPAYAISTSTEMTALDVMVAAFRDLSAVDVEGGTSLWASTTGIASHTPLRSASGSTIAHYVKFNPAGYAVVNNNKDNPVVLEYSEEDHPEPALLAGQYLDFGTAAEQPTGTDDEVGTVSNEAKQQLSAYLQSTDPNQLLAHAQTRYSLTTIGGRDIMLDPKLGGTTLATAPLSTAPLTIFDTAPTASTLGGSYGILKPADLPKQNYSARMLTRASLVTWGTTGEFAKLSGVKNHCGATAAFNVVNYYRVRYGRSKLMLSSRSSTFTALHKKIGNGPVTFVGLTGGLKSYVESRGSSITRTSNGGYANIKTAIDNNRMVIILLAAGLVKWHYVNGLGWRQYSGGAKYIRVMDGWNNTTSRYIRSGNLVGSYVTHIT